MGKDFIQKSFKDSLFTGIIALALFGPIVGLRTVAKNEVLVVEPKSVSYTHLTLPTNREV